MVKEESKPFGMDYVPPAKRAKIVDGKVCAGKISELAPGHAKAIVTETIRIALFNVDGKFYAIKDNCPHAEYPLSKGIIQHGFVTCASHSWKFDIRTGECLRGEAGLTIRTFPVTIQNDTLWITL